jgi:tRNA pseudouridine38-40 synthase
MARYKLTIAYDGRPFDGWQSQAGGRTIQDTVEGVVAGICGESCRVHAAGRTDAGVHALGQVAHFDAPPACGLSELEWHRALNALLPATVRVMRCERVADAFHARFDASAKTYRYRLWHGEVLPPLEAGLAWHLHGPLDAGMLRRAAALFEGGHDFSAFSANRGEPGEADSDKTRTIQRILVAVDPSDAGELISVTMTGDGFLYKMVRMIVGALVHVARGRAPLARLIDLLENPAQQKPGWQAPADGLFLMSVDYFPSTVRPHA